HPQGDQAMHSQSRLFASMAFSLAALSASVLRADIFQWEYVNPADPSQGKQQSMTLCPAGAGVNAVPGAFLAYRDLTKAYLIGADLGPSYYNAASNLTWVNLTQADLTNANLSFATLTNANFSQANLTNAKLGSTALSGVDFTGAEVRGADFSLTTVA